jgi:predicted enzyme related to lactoylglutathione lyase
MKTFKPPILPEVVLCTLLCFAGASAVGGSELQLPPLSTSSSDRLPGKFVWADLVTDDVPAVRKFYGQLFGWIYEDVGGYTIAKNQDRPMAGFFQRQRPSDGEAKPRWFGYISVPNVGKAQRVVTDAGGKVLAEPQKFPDRGEQAVFADPEGAVFGVIKSSSGDPQDFLPEPGDWIWAQLLSRDGVKAGDFYKSVADYEVLENSETERAGDFVLTSKGYARAAVLTIPDTHDKVKPNWLPFVRVTSVNASVAKTKELGGTVLIAPQEKLLAGRLAVVADPTGAAIGILEWNPEEAKGAL